MVKVLSVDTQFNRYGSGTLTNRKESLMKCGIAKTSDPVCLFLYYI